MSNQFQAPQGMPMQAPTPQGLQQVSDIKITRNAYDNLSKYLVEEYMKDPSNMEVEKMYTELTGDVDLSNLKTEMVYKEIKEFTENINKHTDDKGNRPFSCEDSGYDNGTFYIRFWATDFKFVSDNHKGIIDFLQNVADRTGVAISPEFTFYEQLDPSSKKVNEVVEAPKISYSKRMEVELN